VEHNVDAAPSADQWPDTIFAHFQRAGIRQVGYVPDAGHTRLIQRCIDDPAIADVVLTTEEEGVGLVVGAALGTQRAALLMQSSGVGNCVNMFSIVRGFGVPCLVLVTMRGEFAEFNPWQVPMGRATERSLQLMGINVLRADSPDDVTETIAAAADAAYLAGDRVAVLIGQRLIGRKTWIKE
jgi:sulfopyruvate decarboxylase alpha subunit